MNIVYLISQIVGFIAFVISLVAYHRKKKESIFSSVTLRWLLCSMKSVTKDNIFLVFLIATMGFAAVTPFLVSNGVSSLPSTPIQTNL